MRLFLIILLLLAVAALPLLFPEVGAQILRIEAFGWQFESRQGTFLFILVALLLVMALLRRLVQALIAGPGQLWQTMRMGNRKRREECLRDGIAQHIDMRGDFGAKAFGKARGVIPDWGVPLLKAMTVPAKEQPLSSPDDDPLLIAMSARIATDPDASVQPDIATRKAHLEAWLAAHPGAPLAMTRMAELAREEGDWARAAELLEELWKRGHKAAATIKPQLAWAYVYLAEEEPAHRLQHLRKAQRLLPDDPAIMLELGRAMYDNDEAKAAERMWLRHLEQHDNMIIADALFTQMQEDAMAAFRRLEKMQGPAALKWLRARLAHAAKLEGLAQEELSKLIHEEPRPQFLQTRGQWAEEAHDWQTATNSFRQAAISDNSQA
jgi:uncharacterized protein HemY